MSQEYTVRVIERDACARNTVTAEFTGTLQEIVDWAHGDNMRAFSREIDLADLIEYPPDIEQAHQWFTDKWREPTFATSDSDDLFGTWWNDDEGSYVELHENPMPLTVENAKAYVEYSERHVSHSGGLWWVEIAPTNK